MKGTKAAASHTVGKASPKVAKLRGYNNPPGMADYFKDDHHAKSKERKGKK
jgi:hypothetical protein